MAALSDLRTRIKQRTFNEHSGSNFVTDAELTQLINKSQNELFGLLLLNGLDSLPETDYSVTADGSTSYDLPDDFVAVIGVWRQQGDFYIRLPRHNARVKPSSQNGMAESYRVWGQRTGAKLEFNPTPSEGDYVVRYHPALTDLSADSDELDGVIGWEEYVVVDVAIDVLIKMNAPVELIRELRKQKNDMRARIEAEGSLRDMTEHHQVQDVRGSAFNELPGSYGIKGYWG